MKLTQNETIIKVNAKQINTLIQYLTEIATNFNLYIPTNKQNQNINAIHYHNINAIREKLVKFWFNSLTSSIVKHKTKIYNSKYTEAEKLTLLMLVNLYPLPMEINFIEYELKKNLIKN